MGLIDDIPLFDAWAEDAPREARVFGQALAKKYASGTPEDRLRAFKRDRPDLYGDIVTKLEASYEPTSGEVTEAERDVALVQAGREDLVRQTDITDMLGAGSQVAVGAPVPDEPSVRTGDELDRYKRRLMGMATDELRGDSVQWASGDQREAAYALVDERVVRDLTAAVQRPGVQWRASYPTGVQAYAEEKFTQRVQEADDAFERSRQQSDWRGVS